MVDYISDIISANQLSLLLSPCLGAWEQGGIESLNMLIIP